MVLKMFQDLYGCSKYHFFIGDCLPPPREDSNKVIEGIGGRHYPPTNKRYLLLSTIYCIIFDRKSTKFLYPLLFLVFIGKFHHYSEERQSIFDNLLL